MRHFDRFGIHATYLIVYRLMNFPFVNIFSKSKMVIPRMG